jgi:acetylornithine deacetylase/succinyl-diaminopimelate desuccinylase-like protein
MDVVPADEEYWDNPPYSGIIKDSHVIGRGTLDTKSLGIIHLQSLIALKRAGKKLNRDIIFMGTADEEAGGLYGAGWVIKEYPQLFKNGGVLLNEGGAGKINNQGVIFNIEVSQKIPFWLKLTATDIPGHGSVPRVTSAVTRLNRALYQIQTHQFPARIVPSVDKYFKGSSVLQNDDWQDAYMDMENAILEPDFLLKLQLKSNSDHALTRNMCAITRLQGSDKINVIPPTASAEIDCRLLPDQDIDAFLAEINRIINDTNIKVEVILSFTAAESSTNTDLYKSIVAGIEKNHPDSTIIAGVSTGFTDSHFFRDIGIDSYGFAPFIIPEKDRMGAHGNNERISVENIKNGVTLMIDIIEKMVY